MILSDKEILGLYEGKQLGIEPFDDKFLQPSSYDVHLSRFFRIYHTGVRIIDLKENYPETTPFEREAFDLPAKDFILASTVEKVSIPRFLTGRLEGKSSLGRVGITVHVTAGYCDPGFRGHITLEIANLNVRPVRLYAGMPIGQISFHRMSSLPSRTYGVVKGSKYQDQGPAPVESQFWKNFPDKCVGA